MRLFIHLAQDYICLFCTGVRFFIYIGVIYFGLELIYLHQNCADHLFIYTNFCNNPDVSSPVHTGLCYSNLVIQYGVIGPELGQFSCPHLCNSLLWLPSRLMLGHGYLCLVLRIFSTDTTLAESPFCGELQFLILFLSWLILFVHCKLISWGVLIFILAWAYKGNFTVYFLRPPYP